MAEQFLSTAALTDAIADATFDRPPALVSNAHVTGLGVARALDAHDVPVIALDRAAGDGTGGDGGAVRHDGVAPPSAAVDFAGAVTYPLDDLGGFREDVEAVVDAVGTEAVAFGCMDEWALAYARADPEGVRLPFAGIDTLDDVLNKSALYATCEELGVPYPETYRLTETDGAETGTDWATGTTEASTGKPAAAATLDEAAEAIGFPLVVKPELKREFEEAFGTNVIEVADRAEFADVVAAAREAGIAVMAQKRVDIAAGRDHSLASYVPPSGVEDALAVVGNAAVRYPREFGTSCLVRTSDEPAIEERALAVLDDAGYHGISEAEFVYDADREEFLLLDVNTRPWKWIGMPVAAGANLPMAAYAAVTDASYEPTETRPTRWASLRDYMALLAGDDAVWDQLSAADWRRLVSGEFEAEGDLTTAVYRPSDPAPVAKLFETEFVDRDYYCAC
ncbi:carboxylate--amine ligase [Halorubrum trueperi]|uniref:Carboxylate--amine ligase n=1 Tax=Halorubrum trueperi TaxID=2004704 RepID=A0ABD5UKQ3_9EURY